MRPFFLLFLIGAAGCTVGPWFLDRPRPGPPPLSPEQLAQMARCLQPGLTLDTVFFSSEEPHVGPASVREALETYRPVIKAGKLCDRASGKELYFYRVPQYGTDPGPDQIRQDQQEAEELHAKYRVIELCSKILPP